MTRKAFPSVVAALLLVAPFAAARGAVVQSSPNSLIAAAGPGIPVPPLQKNPPKPGLAEQVAGPGIPVPPLQKNPPKPGASFAFFA